ncbi:MAG TPA: hypothetical protein VGA84_03050 [Thermoanaerobaculia bacterium]
MSRFRPAIALAALLFPAVALAGPEKIRLIAPAAGTSLRGGETAAIAWEADSLPPGAEEWEAFLSIDGGRHYPIRITPHLDIDLHRATWTVPNITARDVRVLLRVGDERRESAIEVPASFAIDAQLGFAPIWPAAATSASPGEEARQGDGGVTAWVAGDRQGKRSHLVTARAPQTVRDATLRRQHAAGDPVATLTRAPLAAPPAPSPLILHLTHPRPHETAHTPAPPDVLLSSSRLNI